jgi:hypothetical protein
MQYGLKRRLVFLRQYWMLYAAGTAFFALYLMPSMRGKVAIAAIFYAGLAVFAVRTIAKALSSGEVRAKGWKSTRLVLRKENHFRFWWEIIKLAALTLVLGYAVIDFVFFYQIPLADR